MPFKCFSFIKMLRIQIQVSSGIKEYYQVQPSIGIGKLWIGCLEVCPQLLIRAPYFALTVQLLNRNLNKCRNFQYHHILDICYRDYVVSWLFTRKTIQTTYKSDSYIIDSLLHNVMVFSVGYVISFLYGFNIIQQNFQSQNTRIQTLHKNSL